MDMERLIRAAGILEGEGSFLTKTGGHSPVISCQMTDEDVIMELCNLLGGTTSTAHRKEVHYKPIWVWRISGDPAAIAMQRLRPYMFNRRRESIDKALLRWYDRKDAIEKQRNLVQIAAVAYLNGEGSYRDLGKKYGISHETIRRRVFEID